MRSRPLLLGVFGFVLCLPLCLAQDISTDPTTKFTSSTELVLVPAVVTDGSGTHVANLKKENFVLKEDGKARPISIFEEVNTDATRLQRASGEHGEFSNFEPGGSGYHRLTIVVLDLINTPFIDLSNARKGLFDFFTKVAESGEPMCLLALDRSGVSVIHEFTGDPKILAAALRGLPSNQAPLTHDPVVAVDAPPANDSIAAALRKLVREMVENENQLESQVRKSNVVLTLDGLNQIAAAFGGLPGRKALIWASSGFVYSLSSPNKLMCEPACPVDQRDSVQGRYDQLWRIMNNSQTSIYSVDLRSLPAGSFTAASGNDNFTRPGELGDPTFDKALDANQQAQDTTTSLKLFAENTGGKAFTNTNDLSQAFHQAVQDDSRYYMLGFYVNRRDTKPGWHKLSVNVLAKGVHPRFRNGFLLSPENGSDPGREEMRLALISPLNYTGIPLKASWIGASPGKSGKSQMKFELVMPAKFASVDQSDRNHMLIDIAAVARTSKGDAAGESTQRIDSHLNPDALTQIQQNGMTYHGALQLAPGDYTVHFVIRDALAGRIGSVIVPVKVAP